MATPEEYLFSKAFCIKALKVNSSHTPAKDKEIVNESNPCNESLIFNNKLLVSSTTSLTPKNEVNTAEINKSNKNNKPPKTTPKSKVLGFTSNPM